MAFTKDELNQYIPIMDNFIEKRRPPEEVRSQVDLGYKIEKQSLLIFEIRPLFMKPKKKIESMVAKTTYDRTNDVWNVYWQRSDLKWHSYEPVSEVESLLEFLRVVEEDDCACFWG